MRLTTYLKQFKNIAWYPSAYKDSLAMACLSLNSLRRFGVKKEEVPDCFIYTDYDSFSRYADNYRFFMDLEEDEDGATFNYDNAEQKVTLHNIKELEKIKVSFDSSLVTGEYDRYYGHVFVADAVVDHPTLGRMVTKLVYVIAENTAFAFDFLLKNKINIKYAIHSRYGHGFGGGISCGAYMFHILKDLGT